MSDSPVFARQRDGSITVDRWTPTLIVSNALLESAGDGMTLDGDLLTLKCANGSATYLRRENHPDILSVAFDLIEGQIT